jgi:hypothetical protein
MDRAQMQALETRAPITIKFASLVNGHLVPDSSTLYEGLYEKLPEGWAVGATELIETRTEHTRPARPFEHPDAPEEFIAIEHETGLEFVLMGIAAPLAAAAVQKLVATLWDRWGRRRGERSMPAATLVVEGVREQSPDGGIKTSVRMVVTKEVSEEELPQLLESFQQHLR